jgi:hypothetical protein
MDTPAASLVQLQDEVERLRSLLVQKDRQIEDLTNGDRTRAMVEEMLDARLGMSSVHSNARYGQHLAGDYMTPQAAAKKTADSDADSMSQLLGAIPKNGIYGGTKSKLLSGRREIRQFPRMKTNDNLSNESSMEATSDSDEENKKNTSPSTDSSESSSGISDSSLKGQQQKKRGLPRRRSHPSKTKPRQSRKSRRSPPPPKMATFCGDPKTWNAFYFQFEHTAKVHQWDDEERLERLLSCLRDKVVDFVRRRPARVQKDFRRLVKELEKRYGYKEHPSAIRKQLEVTRQGETEPLEDFADRIYGMVLEGYPNGDESMLQLLAADRFLQACKDDQASYMARERNPTTIRKALKYVKNSINNLKAFGKRRSHSNTRQVTFQLNEDKLDEAEEANVRQVAPSLSEMEGLLSKFKIDITQELDRRLKRLGENDRRGRFRSPSPGAPSLGHRSPSTSPSRSPSRDITCYLCREKGHISRECPNRTAKQKDLNE